MNSRSSESPADADGAISNAAAQWVVKRDRGLTSAEEAEFSSWLRADPRHATTLNQSSTMWKLIDRIPEDVARSFLTQSPRRSFRLWYLASGLAAAAAIAFGYMVWQPSQASTATVLETTATETQSKVLSDGSIVQLNAGSEVIERFTSDARHVELTRGEAHFAVTKNPARPFIVHAGNVEFRAVGTAFDVNLLVGRVQLLVTEGKVQVSSASTAESRPTQNALGNNNALPDPTTEPLPILTAGQRAIVKLERESLESAIEVTQVNTDEWTHTMAWAWQRPLMRLGGATLSELADEFRLRTGKRLVLEDSSLAELRVGGRIWADDAVSFVRVLEESYGLKSETAEDGSILLRKSR